jgi:hypothetical protein
MDIYSYSAHNLQKQFPNQSMRYYSK